MMDKQKIQEAIKVLKELSHYNRLGTATYTREEGIDAINIITSFSEEALKPVEWEKVLPKKKENEALTASVCKNCHINTRRIQN